MNVALGDRRGRYGVLTFVCWFVGLLICFLLLLIYPSVPRCYEFINFKTTLVSEQPTANLSA